MHIAAASPLVVRREDLQADLVEKEREIFRAQFAASGKPANVIDKIVESGLKTFYKEVCLVDQAFVHDASKSVAQAVKEAEGQVGAPIRIKGFVRFALAEGIEKTDA